MSQYPWMELDESVEYLTENISDIRRAIDEILPEISEHVSEATLKEHFPAVLAFQEKLNAFDRDLATFMDDAKVKDAIQQDKAMYNEDDREPSWV